MSYESVGASKNRFLPLEGQGAFSTVWRAVHKTSGQVGESKLQTKISGGQRGASKFLVKKHHFEKKDNTPSFACENTSDL